MKKIESTSTLLILKNYAMVSNLRIETSQHLNSFKYTCAVLAFSSFFVARVVSN
ncbi:MAG: hypothetical protein WCO37_06615 [Bacteroidota bacterium]|jgi:hypothetical protein